MQSLRKLFLMFFKIGLFTFGGGYAMLPLLKSEVVDKKHFLSEEELLDLYSIGQCTPGIIAVNVATFIGYKRQGLKGAIASVLGIITPSILIICIIAGILNKFMDNRYVAQAFAGIRIGVVALIIDVVLGMIKKNINNLKTVIIFLSALAGMVFLKLSAVLIIVLVGLISLAIGEIKVKR